MLRGGSYPCLAENLDARDSPWCGHTVAGERSAAARVSVVTHARPPPAWHAGLALEGENTARVVHADVAVAGGGQREVLLVLVMDR